MSLTLYVSCDVLACNRKAIVVPDPTPIVLEDDFVIDQHFELPDGWAYTDDLSPAPEGKHICPVHTEADLGVEGELRHARALWA